MYRELRPGADTDRLVSARVLHRVDPALQPKIFKAYSTDPTANAEMVEFLRNAGFEFEEETARKSGPFFAAFRTGDKEFRGRSFRTQLLANCEAALKVADYLDSLDSQSKLPD